MRMLAYFGTMWRPALLITVTFVAFGVMTVAFADATAKSSYLPTQIPRDATEGPTTVEVQPGDHLWRISAKFLSDRLGREPPGDVVAPLWREVIATNIAGLRSGNPDLIYPGELISIPDPG